MSASEIISGASTLLEIKGIIYDKVVGFDEKIRRKFVNALKVAMQPTVKDNDWYINNAARQIDDLISFVILVMDEPSLINTIALPNYITREEFRRFYTQTNKDEELQNYLANKLQQCQNKGIFTEVKATGHKVDKLIESNEEIKGGIKDIKEQLSCNAEASNANSIKDLYKCLDDKLQYKRENHPSFQLMKIDDRLFPNAQTKTKNKQIKLEALDSNDELKTVKDIIEESWRKGEKNHLMIEGDGGIGKTVTLLSIPDIEKFAPHYVPAIYIPLHELSTGEDPIERYIKKHILNHNQALLEQIFELANEPWDEGPRLLLLLDGFNEITTEQRVPLGKDIGCWSEFSGVQIITSSRYDIHTYVALGKNYSAIKLQSLSDKTVENYLKSMGIRVPTEDAVKKLITTPLMLTLYAMTERVLEERECDSSDFKEVKSAGSIVWNYLQCELWNFGKEGEDAKNAIIAMEFIAPYMAWRMQQNTLFRLSKKEFHKFLEEAYQLLEKHFDKTEKFPFHISDAIQTSNGIPPLDLIRSLLESKLCLFVKNGNQYRLMHQQFRDALAAMHLINLSYLSGDSLPQEWNAPIDHYVMQFIADLISEEEATRMWERNRNTKPAIDDATRNQLRLQRLLHDNDLSHLDFSELDLRNISLYPYRYGKATLKLPTLPEKMNKTRLSARTFSPEGHEDRVNAVAVTLDGKRIVSGSVDRTICVWDLETGAAIGKPIKGHQNWVRSVAVTPDGKRIVSGSDDRTIRVWDLETGVAIGSPIEGHENYVTAVAVTPDGKRIVSGSWDRTIRVWDLETGVAIGKPIKGHKDCVTAIAVTPDGKHIVSGSWDRTIRVWDLETGAAIWKPIEGHNGTVRSVAVTPDGNRIVSGSGDGTIRVWDLETGVAIGNPIEGHKKRVHAVALTPDGKRIVSGSGDGTIRVWDLETGAAIGNPIEGHEGGVTAVAVTPDGKCIASGSEDNTIRVWDLETGAAIGSPIEGHQDWKLAVAVTPDGKHTIKGTYDGRICITNRETNGDKTIKIHPLSFVGLDFSKADISDAELKETLRQNGAKV